MESTNYVPYGPEWERELMRLPKNEIIKLFARTIQSTAGVQLIAKERLRQIHVEHHSKEGDIVNNEANTLSNAALCYLIPPDQREEVEDPDGVSLLEYFWPWESIYFKPTPDDRMRELTKAGALVAAEIDRIMAINVKASFVEGDTE